MLVKSRLVYLCLDYLALSPVPRRHTYCLPASQATHPGTEVPPPNSLSSPGPCGHLRLTMVALWAPWHLMYKTPQHSPELWPSGPELGLPTYVPASDRPGAQRQSPLRGPRDTGTVSSTSYS